MHEIPVKCFSVSCFLIRDNGTECEVLILKRAEGDSFGGEWCQVAGSMEKDETPVDAVRREIAEETSVEVTELYSAMECEQYYRPDLNCISILPVFVAFIAYGENVTLNNEHSEYRWVEFATAKELLSLPIQRKILNNIESDFLEIPPSRWLRV